MTGRRLDTALVERGLTRSRTAAATAIAEGRVLVDGRVVQRAAEQVGEAQALRVTGDDGWVGRAAGKLDAALDAFQVDVAGLRALDLGASTGGFTQVLLARGAARVVALDVGHGQLVPDLRDDPRVVVVEGENARDLTPERLAHLAGDPLPPEAVVADLSFISLRLVLPAIAAVAARSAHVVLLVKPQFEVGRVRDGVVRRAEDRASAVRGVLQEAWRLGLGTRGLVASAVPGGHGNLEVLAHLHRTAGSDPAEWGRTIDRVVRGPEGVAR